MLTLSQRQAITLLRCAADGDSPSLVDAIIAFNLYNEPEITAIAFSAVDKADPDYGESFAHLYEEDHREGMRHCFLEAAMLIEEGVIRG